jgi:Tat protein secretion system quality control protein TatD with DNase activity
MKIKTAEAKVRLLNREEKFVIIGETGLCLIIV